MRALYLIVSVAILTQVPNSKAAVEDLPPDNPLHIDAIAKAIDTLGDLGNDYKFKEDLGVQLKTDDETGLQVVVAKVNLTKEGETWISTCWVEFNYKDNELTNGSNHCVL